MGLNKASKSGSESIKTSFTTFFQMERGYDFIKSNMINIYPFAGIGLRSSLLKYNSAKITNSVFSNVTGIIQNDKSFNESTIEFGYQAGLGLEIVITKRSKQSGTLLFFKGGTNMPFKKKSFKVEGINYDPNFKYGELVGAVGFKFFGR